MHTIIPHQQRRQEYHKDGIPMATPPKMELLERATVVKSDHWILVTSTDQIATGTTDSSKYESFMQEWQVWTEHIGDCSILAEMFKHGKSVAVSNRSYMESIGMAARTIKGPTASNWVIGTRYTTSGVPADQNAY